MPLIRKVTLLLCVALVGILAVATFMEPVWGTEQVTRYIYHGIPFCMLWGGLSMLTLWILYKQRMWKCMPLFLLHCSLILVLLGSLMTFLTGKQGSIHLRVGMSAFQYIEDGTNLTKTLPFTLRLDTFEVKHYPETDLPSDYVSTITCHSLRDSIVIHRKVSMNNVWDYQGYRFYQSSYDEDRKGSWLGVNHDPWGMAITYAGYVLLFISMAVVLCRKWNLFYGILIVVTLLLICFFQFKVRNNPMIPILVSPWFSLHLSFVFLSYTLLILISLNGILGLLWVRYAEWLMNFSRKLLFPAVFLLGAGIFVGAVWANESWGRYWAWDPKEVWALITFMVYSLPLHSESFSNFRHPRFFHIYMLVAIFTVLMTYLGVNTFLGGMHSYG